MRADVLVPGSASAAAIVLDEPLSFWGGLDTASGRITDVHHPQHGKSIAGKVLLMPFARGSSSTANSLAEAIHRGTGPAAIVLTVPDEIVVLGATVAGELYGEWVPVVVLGPDDYPTIATGDDVAIEDDGSVRRST